MRSHRFNVRRLSDSVGRVLGLLAGSVLFTASALAAVPSIHTANPPRAAAGSTLSVTLAGTGFINGSTVLVNGATVPSTYQSSTSIVAKIAVPAGSTKSLNVQVKNAGTGGGTSANFSLGVECVQLVAKSPDGTNTGTGRVGSPVEIATVLSNIPNNPRRNWTMTGAGTLAVQDGSGWAIYTPPATIPANRNVTVSVTSGTDPVAGSTYSFIIDNPIPVVTSSSPAQLLSAGTQTISLDGVNFLPSMTVVFEGNSYPITLRNSTRASVKIPIPATARGTLTFLAENPDSGGGSATFTATVPVNAITLTATNAEGVNTGTAGLMTTIDMSAAVTGSEQTAVNWSLAGAGTISGAGVYTAPSTLPANQAATITAKLASDTAVMASYSFNIVNPVPAITDANPFRIKPGQTDTVTFSGTGFLPSTVVLVNGARAATTYVSSTEVIAKVPVPAKTIGNLTIQAENPAPGGGTGPEYPEAITSAVSLTEAGRILDQTTFGPTTASLAHVEQIGLDGWLAEQYNAPPTLLPIVSNPIPGWCSDAALCVQSEWWHTILNGNDQLRQRVAYALSQLFVVSSDNVSGWGIQYYQNLLAKDAFTNWYQIMTDVTLSPAMAIYLNMANSSAPAPGQIANENFARENMQLFNMGLDLINQDGTPQYDAGGNLIPAYTQAQVEAFARLFTGWTFANTDGSTPNALNNPVNFYDQMVAIESSHDHGSKALLNNVTLNPNQSAEQDLAQGLTNIFEHPNVPPFVATQLIQHLVKSNPSPAYVSRVAAAFINNGNNVRGDMQSVLTAIFTDPEARAGDTAPQASDGHLREPVLWLANVMRALGFVNLDPNNYYRYLSEDTAVLNEVPYASPAVFNFFPPTYVIPGTALTAPEFGLENTASVTDRMSLADTIVNNNLWDFNIDLSETSPLALTAIAHGSAALVQQLNDLFLYGTMDTATANAIVHECTTIKDPAQKVRVAVYLVITSSEYKILH